MPRIAHVISTPSGVGGAEQTLAYLVAEGRRRDWDQLILNPFSNPAGGDALERILAPTTLYTRACVSWRQVAGTRRWLSRQIRAFRPDMVHCHLFHAAVMTATIKKRGCLLLSHQHGALFVARNEPILQAVDRACGHRFDRVVGCSDAVATFLRTTYHYPENKVSFIRNGWEGQPLPGPGRAERPTIVCIANFRPEKGHDVLLRAFQRVLTDVADAELVLIGDGPLRRQTAELAASMGIARNINFTGPVEDVWPYLAEAHIFALSSWSEPLGIVVLEAMAAGLPVVATAVGGVTELVEHGVTGVLVPPGDHVEMADALVGLLRSDDRRHQMAEPCRKTAAAHTSDVMVRRYFELYDNLLATGDGR